MASLTEPTIRAWRGRAVVAAVLALLGSGCKSGDSFKDKANALRASLFEAGYEDARAQEKFAAAEQLYADGEYARAQSAFRDIADNQYNPADLAEHARFMQAECRLMRRQYPEAVDTYHRLLKDFPTGAHRRESCARIFEVCDYWLDDFREELQQRADEGGVLRWRPAWKNPFDPTKPWVGQEGRTLEALEHVHTHDMVGPTADKALFWCGYVNYVRGEFQEADHFFSMLVEMHKDSPLRPQAIAYAIQAKNNSTGGSEYDGRKCAEALQLVHTAEASVPELTQVPAMAEKLTRARVAIRYQQAEKDFKTAEYYERTGHPGSAVFYYELVRRRYAGTRYADLADGRKEHLMAAMRDGRPLPGHDPIAVLQAKWKEVFVPGKARPAEEGDPRKGVVTAGGPLPPSTLSPGP